MICNFEQLVQQAKTKQGIVIGVPAPEDASSILTAIAAQKEALGQVILCGKKAQIIEQLAKYGSQPSHFEIIDKASDEEAASTIVQLAREKKVHVILKGFLPTAKLMKPILEKETGLRTGSLLSDILVVENPACPELLGMSDGGLNILPDLQQKKQIVENAVRVFHQLGYPCPRVGIMAAIESVKDNMPATVDAAQLTQMNQRGEIANCSVYGPLALDIAVSVEAATHKGIASPVAGRVQIMIVPNIESGNLLGKSFTYYLKIPVAHVVMGAQIPILIPSRNESEKDKFYSVALGVMIAEK